MWLFDSDIWCPTETKRCLAPIVVRNSRTAGHSWVTGTATMPAVLMVRARSPATTVARRSALAVHSRSMCAYTRVSGRTAAASAGRWVPSLKKAQIIFIHKIHSCVLINNANNISYYVCYHSMFVTMALIRASWRITTDQIENCDLYHRPEICHTLQLPWINLTML